MSSQRKPSTSLPKSPKKILYRNLPFLLAFPSIKPLLAPNHGVRNRKASLPLLLGTSHGSIPRLQALDLSRSPRLVAVVKPPNDDARLVHVVGLLYVLAPAPRVSVVPLLRDVVPIDAVALRSGGRVWCNPTAGPACRRWTAYRSPRRQSWHRSNSRASSRRSIVGW